MRRPFTPQLFFACAATEGIISIVLLSFIPADPDNVWILGRSMTRMAMIAASFGLSLLFAWLAFKASRDSDWRERFDHWIGGYVRSERWLTALVSLLVAGLLTGAYLQLGEFTAAEPMHRSYLVRFGPWSLWLAMLCLTGLVFVWVHNQDAWHDYLRVHRTSLLAINCVLLLAAIVHMHVGNMDLSTVKTYSASDQLGTPIEEQDIYTVYLEGQNLLHGVNPYAKNAGSGASDARFEPAGYLPFMYYASWATQRVGFSDFGLWLDVWQGVFLFFNLAIAYTLFHIGTFVFDRRVLGILASLLWLFNRWTLYVTTVFQFDFIPIFFLVVSLALLPRNRLASYLLFGLSLAVKHIGIFLVPLYLIWAWRAEGDRRLRELVVCTLAIGLIPFLTSLPFLVVSPLGFFDGIWYSVARLPGTHLGALSLDALLGWGGASGKLPLLGLLLLIYWIAWKSQLSYNASSLLVLLVFVDFNSNLFNQYVAWTAPLILLTIIETTSPHLGKPAPVVIGR